MKKGIDVSSYQGTVDWKKVKKAGIKYAILKIIRKDLQPDKQFENNWKGCEGAGVPIQGVYNYTYATTVAKAEKDAKRVVFVLLSFILLSIISRPKIFAVSSEAIAPIVGSFISLTCFAAIAVFCALICSKLWL